MGTIAGMNGPRHLFTIVVSIVAHFAPRAITAPYSPPLAAGSVSIDSPSPTRRYFPFRAFANAHVLADIAQQQ